MMPHRTLTDVCRWHDAALERGLAQGPDRVSPGHDLESLVLAQHFCNVTQWDLEDEARRRDVPDANIADTKRAIDASNRRRNDLIERIDRCSRRSPTSMSRGRMILHMSRIAARGDDASLAAEAAAKTVVLRVQREGLDRCLQRLLADCGTGRRFFKLYRQFTAYDDPRLNGALSRSR